MDAGLSALIVLAVFVFIVAASGVRIVPQARAGIVERFGKYRSTLPAGLNVVVPFVDRLRYMIDLREQVVSFPPQPVITEDNLVVSIDTVRLELGLESALSGKRILVPPLQPQCPGDHPSGDLRLPTLIPRLAQGHGLLEAPERLVQAADVHQRAAEIVQQRRLPALRRRLARRSRDVQSLLI